jgi:hypothetical protein
VRRRQRRLDDDAVPVLDQYMRRVTQLRFFALCFLGQQGVGVRGRSVRLVRAPFAMKVDRRVARIVV